MPRFTYLGKNAQGQEVQGELDAADANAVAQLLGQQGISLKRLQRGGAAARPAPTQQRAPVATTSLATPSAPVAPSQRVAPLSPQPAAVTPSAPATPHGGRALSHAQAQFLFSQLGQLLQAGISPADAWQRLAVRESGARRALYERIAKGAGQGKSMGELMASAPEVFPVGAAGAVKAGELGGYLPDACRTIAVQEKAHNKFRWMMWILGVNLVGLILAFPLAFIGRDAIDGAIGTINTGEAPVGVMLSRSWQSLTSGAGLVALLIALGFLFGYRWYLRASKARGLRHRLAFRVPPFSRRTRAECGAALAWHLGRMAEAGIAPGTAWNTAVTAVPNEAFAAELSRAGSSDHVRLSDLLGQSRALPIEMRHLVETGELTGTVPAALEETRGFMADQLEAVDRHLVFRTVGFLIILGALTLIPFVIFYRGYFDSIFRHLLEP